jgi:ketosteroid isomerase-like protein
MGAEGSGSGLEKKDVDTVLTGYRRWNAGDLAGLSSLFAADITYQNAPEWPGQRVYHGVAAVTSFLEDEVARIIALRPVKIVSTEIVGSEILIELEARTHGTLSGLDIEDMSVFHLAQVEGGRVSRVRVYLQRDEATRAAETGED